MNGKHFVVCHLPFIRFVTITICVQWLVLFHKYQVNVLAYVMLSIWLWIHSIFFDLICRLLKLKVYWNQSFQLKNFQVHNYWSCVAIKDRLLSWLNMILSNILTTKLYTYLWLEIIFWIVDILAYIRFTITHFYNNWRAVYYLCISYSVKNYSIYIAIWFVSYLYFFTICSLCAWDIYKELGFDSSIWSETHAEIACSFLSWFTNRWRSNKR